MPSTVTAMRGAPLQAMPRARTTTLSVAACSVTDFDAEVVREKRSAFSARASASAITSVRELLRGLERLDLVGRDGAGLRARGGQQQRGEDGGGQWAQGTFPRGRDGSAACP